MIQSIQCSIFLLAINHMAVKRKKIGEGKREEDEVAWQEIEVGAKGERRREGGGREMLKEEKTVGEREKKNKGSK